MSCIRVRDGSVKRGTAEAAQQRGAENGRSGGSTTKQRETKQRGRLALLEAQRHNEADVATAQQLVERIPDCNTMRRY